MIHPLFRLIASEPQMLADHVEAYTDLVGEELAHATARWKRQVISSVILFLCALLAVLLIGVSLMLWAVTPTSQMPAPWALIVVPLVPTIAAVAAWFGTRNTDKGEGFAAIKAQLAADAAMLRSVTAP